MAQGDNIIPIPGTKKIKYPEQNVEAIEVEFSQAELLEIQTLVDKYPLSGDYN